MAHCATGREESVTVTTLPVGTVLAGAWQRWLAYLWMTIPLIAFVAFISNSS